MQWRVFHPARKPRCDRRNRRLCPGVTGFAPSDCFSRNPCFPDIIGASSGARRRRRWHPSFCPARWLSPLSAFAGAICCVLCTDASSPDRRKKTAKHRPSRYRLAQPGTETALVCLEASPTRKTACIHRILDHGKFKRHQPVFHRRKHRSVPDLSGWDVPVVPPDPPASLDDPGRATARRKCDANSPDRPFDRNPCRLQRYQHDRADQLYFASCPPRSARLLFKKQSLIHHVIQWPARRMPFDARRYFCPQHRFYRTASKYFYQFARRAVLNLSLYQEETTSMNLLTVTNLSAGYAGKQVIKDISFFVAPKRSLESSVQMGCGKPPLIKAIAKYQSCQLDDTAGKRFSKAACFYSADTFPQKRAVLDRFKLFLDVVLTGFNPKLSPAVSYGADEKKEAFDAPLLGRSWVRKDDNFQQLESEGLKAALPSGAHFCIQSRLSFDEPESALDFGCAGLMKRWDFCERRIKQRRRTCNAARSFFAPQPLRDTPQAHPIACLLGESFNHFSNSRFPKWNRFFPSIYGTISLTTLSTRRGEKRLDHDKGGRCLLKAVTRIFCDDNDENFLGRSPCRLLHAIEETGLFVPPYPWDLFTPKRPHNQKCRSRSRLSTDPTLCWRKIRRWKYTHPQGKEWLTKYETYRDACVHANRKLYLEIFSDKR